MKPKVEHELALASQREAEEAQRLAQQLLPLVEFAIREQAILDACAAAGCTPAEIRLVMRGTDALPN